MPDDIMPVLVPVPLDGPFDYKGGELGPLAPGTIVRVPFGGRRLPGVVWDRRGGKAIAADRLRTVEQVSTAPPLPPPVRALVDHVARETLAARGAVLKLALSVPSALEPWPSKLAVRAGRGEAGTRRRQAVLDALGESTMLAADLAKAAGAGPGLIQTMLRCNLLLPVELPDRPIPAAADPWQAGVELSAAQASAAARLTRRVRHGGFAVDLLEGVPGSGKTEVYLEAVAEALREGRRVLVLLPEIALSAQWLARFSRRFGAPPAVWHSALTSSQRRRTWRLAAEGALPVMVGARSALFLPLPEVGLIVVDEEHDASFKQGDGVSYHARDMALARARLEGCPVILATATPSVETAVAAGAVADGPLRQQGWDHLLLPARHGSAVMPAVELVDLRRDRPPRGGFISPRLRTALEEALTQGRQSLLFLNRRGYAPLTVCRACGHRMACPNCSAWLVDHHLRRRLICHHCGFGMPEPEHCVSCGAVGMLAASGPGVERLADEVADLFPEARVNIATSDTVGSARAATELVETMEQGEIDVLIGTQIVAKGHHFPQLTLVGVVDADLGLGGGDLRAAERTFQLLYQVAGRAGREALPGRVLIQTHLPDHPVLQAMVAADKDRFLMLETEERRAAGMPPFGRLAAILLQGTVAARVKEQARRVAQAAPSSEHVTLLGPAPAPLALLRGRYRERLLVKATTDVDLPTWLRVWLGPLRLPSAVQLIVDVDPYSFL